MVITDSGGLQEEAPSFGKPILVLRKVTERLEAVHSGNAKIVGVDPKNIIDEVNKLLSDHDLYKSMSSRNNPFGDGNAAEKIKNIVFEKLLLD